MVGLYPYQLYAFLHPSDAIKDGNGNYISTNGSWVLMSNCRDEANTGGQIVQLADGSQPVYSSLINLPIGSLAIPQGTEIEVRDGTSVRLNSTCLRYQRDRLHCRLWV